ncbi:glycoside hydrolase family 2 TIM barrel-domain containing protein [Pedobacter sp. B4-66]|uniref:glycoside hydrolase family 2 TIM barrel-domain containing protein n=1 Tax=Pedobacter sp. B4-66 TaxID=2817280 RepID=UPI001BD9C12A|nr:glycoside hydrolase family 2 TIM barrel-domain containing protein [Pedobacter sp. B4-66]
MLSELGGNTIRTFDTTHIDSILKKANETNIAVIIGLPIPESKHMYFYNNDVEVSKQFKSIQKLVNRVKNDPSVLMWCVGNELVFPYKPSYNKFYRAFNDIVDMIHRDDPDHPVTTTMINFQRKTVFNLKMRTDIDIVSFNVFGGIRSFSQELKDFSWFWDGPYLLTEWGIDGPWDGTPETAWGAKIEPTSTKKAEQYYSRYKEQIPYKDPRLLGSFIFYWGQKQETTPTWFSIFDEAGNKTEVVDAAEAIWKGKQLASAAPQINYMLLNNKGAKDNIFLKPHEKNTAEVFMLKGDVSNKRIVWEIYPEDWYKIDSVNNTKKPLPINGLVEQMGDLKVIFYTPKKEGPYRIFATIYDDKGYVATCNTPFYVLKTDESSRASN